MKIVVLDGFTLNPGDLSWDDLKALGDCDIFDRTPTAGVVDRAAGAEIVLTNKTIVSREHIEHLPELKYIGVLATGFNIVDVAAARARNIPVTNVPTYGTQSVAQHTIALLLELTQHAGHHAEAVRAGRWTRSPDFSFQEFPLIELAGLTMGIVGLGRIGKAVADLALAFGMNVLATGSKPRPDQSGIRFVDVETVFRESDVVSLHCPLTPETRNLVNAQRLQRMKPTAFLLNTSRGPLIDEAALAAALNAGRIAGAGLDVLSVEPPPAGNPLFEARNCLITPHIAWATRAARARLMQTAVANVRAFLKGDSVNVVN
ncbi:MAG TPA: D-2-hydroxyacid dehydrogenase [Candidatus Nitrosotalea sp.]|nr:D-2-hydroxyacid dehydrogenase [Candidatus Nitrosotalea sp.]